MNYLISRVRIPKGICNLGAIENVPEWARMMQGASQSETFPADAQFRMDSDRPKDIKLADALLNMNRFLVVSERLKDLFVEWEALTRNEVYEVSILNHKGRLEKAKYFLIHQYDLPPCADEALCDGDKSPLDPSQYIALRKLVLDESKIDPNLAIFRPAQYKARPFFRRDVAEKILAAGITAFEFSEIDGYTEF